MGRLIQPWTIQILAAHNDDKADDGDLNVNPVKRPHIRRRARENDRQLFAIELLKIQEQARCTNTGRATQYIVNIRDRREVQA